MSADAQWGALREALAAHRAAGRRIVTTNGCFDVIHAGHLSLLEQARALGDVLVVGINSDDSVRRLKGPDRPRMSAEDRARLLAALAPVDHVVVFDDDLPLRFIEEIRPDVHVKGGDYDAETMPETKLVRAHGGRVEIVPLVAGRSSSALAVPMNSDVSEPIGRAALLDCLRWSNVVRQTGYALADKIATTAAAIHAARARGAKIFVYSSEGTRFSGELAGAIDVGARMDDARLGDVLLAVAHGGAASTLAEAKKRGLTTVVVAAKSPRLKADHVLEIALEDPIEIRIAERAILSALFARLAASGAAR